MAVRTSHSHVTAEPALSLSNGTEGLLRQTAAHLSKMRGGASIGGFPRFEPLDDEKYRRKIKEQNYSAQDVSDWIKQINNFLQQIITKNPRMSLEEILRKQELTPSQIENFLDALRDAEVTVRGMQNYGVAPETATMLRTLTPALAVTAGASVETLGVPPWLY